MAKLYFMYSTMNAGKSTLLLQAAHNYEERGMSVLLLTAHVDGRAGGDGSAAGSGLAATPRPSRRKTICSRGWRRGWPRVRWLASSWTRRNS